MPATPWRPRAAASRPCQTDAAERHGRGCTWGGATRDPGPGSVRGPAGGTPPDAGGAKRQARLAMLALRRTQVVDVDSLSTACGERPVCSTECAPSPHRPFRAALGEELIVGPLNGYALADARIDADRVRAAAGGRRAQRCAAATTPPPRRRPPAARPLARAGASGPDRHVLVQRRGQQARDAARRRARGAVRGSARAGRAPGARPPLRSALADNPFRERRGDN